MRKHLMSKGYYCWSLHSPTFRFVSMLTMVGLVGFVLYSAFIKSGAFCSYTLERVRTPPTPPYICLL